MSNLRRIRLFAISAVVLFGWNPIAMAQITQPRIQFPSGPTDAPALAPTADPSLAPPVLGPPPGSAIGPPATFGGSIAPASPGFDPYADPTLPSSQPYYTPGGAPPFGSDPSCATCPPLAQQGTYGQWPRFLQQIRFRTTWMPRNGTNGLGFTTAELSGTFLVPFLFNQNAPLLITPGFVTHFVDGPPFSNTGADLPAQLYDAFVDVAWTPQVTQFVSADLGFRVGAFSDFDQWTTQSLRYQGRGFAVIRPNDTHEWRAGVVYLDRNAIKLLPAGGLIWRPGGPAGNVRWEILFPNPKLAFRMSNFSNSELWWYVAGEYGGGDWTIRRQNGSLDQVTYEDIRIVLGIESIGYRGFRGMLEVGYVTRRRLDYFSNNLDYKPGDTFMVRGGLTY